MDDLPLASWRIIGMNEGKEHDEWLGLIIVLRYVVAILGGAWAPRGTPDFMKVYMVRG